MKNGTFNSAYVGELGPTFWLISCVYIYYFGISH